MLTTSDSRKIEQNVVTDVNANLVPETPKPRATLSPEAALLFNKSIVARPLMVPEVCSVRVKNTEYRYRWVNFEGRGGIVYAQRKAQGFTNATTEDVEILGGEVTADKGEIRAGDVILMKIRADLYDAAIKHNMEKALVLQRSRGMYLKSGSSDVNSDEVAQATSIANESFAKVGKADSFIPANPEELLKRAEPMAAAAKEQIQEIRDNIASGKPPKAAPKKD